MGDSKQLDIESGRGIHQVRGKEMVAAIFVQDACEVLSDPVVFEQRPEGNVEGTVQGSEGRSARLRRAKAKA